MSKMDNLRAMREAKYAETLKRSAAAAKGSGAKPTRADPATPSPSPVAARGARAPTPVASPDETPGATETALCGHRNMSGRTCTREHGHAAKSHRYS